MSVVGLDIGKLNFVACYKTESQCIKQTFDNTPDGFQKFCDWKNDHNIYSAHYCMESTGKYGYALAYFLFDKNEKVSVVNPSSIKFFGKSLMLRNKTDEIDAELIAHFCEARQPSLWSPKPANLDLLGSLLKRIEQLTIMRNQENNRLEAETKRDIINSIQIVIEALDQQIKETDNRMQNIISDDDDLSKKAKKLSSIKGVGDRTIQMFLANFSDLEKFSHPKQICAFIGINPSQSQSGTSLNNSTMSKMGNAFLRKTLYMPTLCSTVHNPVVREFYQRLVANGKPKKLAVCASMRKLIFLMYGVLKNNCDFNPEYAKV